MISSREWILDALASGDRLSGRALGERLGISRAAVGRQIRALRAAGWSIEGRVGQGYRLTGPGRPLRDAGLWLGAEAAGARIAAIERLARVTSTSDYLATCSLPADGSARVCIAEQQTAGRGRRGRQWFSRPAASITLSVARWIPLAPAQLSTLGLAAAVAIAETLELAGAESIGLKWPNDLECAGAKLGGILIDVSGEAGGPARTVIGIGLNHDLGGEDGRRLGDGRVITDIASVCRSPPARDELAGRVAAAVVRAGDELVEQGFAGFGMRWQRFDTLAGKTARVIPTAGEPIDGTVVGVDGQGALVLEHASGRSHFTAGEVSARAAS